MLTTRPSSGNHDRWAITPWVEGLVPVAMVDMLTVVVVGKRCVENATPGAAEDLRPRDGRAVGRRAHRTGPGRSKRPRESSRPDRLSDRFAWEAPVRRTSISATRLRRPASLCSRDPSSTHRKGSAQGRLHRLKRGRTWSVTVGSFGVGTAPYTRRRGRKRTVLH